MLEETMKEYRTVRWQVNIIPRPEEDYLKNKIGGYRQRQTNKILAKFYMSILFSDIIV